MKLLLALGLGFTLWAGARAAPGDWTGDYEPCERHADLLNREHMRLGVRFSTLDPRLRKAFSSAMDFWAGVLDMEWHEESSNVCALAVLDGTAGLFRRAEAARAQFPNSPAFRGWIAFNPKMGLSQREQYVVAVHELGHLFGLAHNSNPSSVMYFIPLEGQLFLDRADLTELACRHKLRIPRITGPLALSDPSLERQTGQSF